MKPAQFDYLKPASLQEALDWLDEHGDGCKLLAGGQTLVPMMNFRLAGAPVLIDINGIPGLDGIVSGADGLTIGALVRWRDIETSPVIAAANPLLAHAVHHIAHYQIRNRGTWAGSSAHADPAAEFPAVAIACGAEFEIRSARGERTVPAEEFFVDALTTVLEPEEMLVAAHFPAWPAGRKWGFEEFSFRTGDFAIAGIAALMDCDSGARIVCFGVGDKQTRLASAEAALAGGLSPEAIDKAAQEAAGEVEAQEDGSASAEYRRCLVQTLARRVLNRMAGREAADE